MEDMPTKSLVDDRRDGAERPFGLLSRSFYLLVRYITSICHKVITSRRNPADAALEPVSRTVGADRVIGE
jgi:hypothetical protein